MGASPLILSVPFSSFSSSLFSSFGLCRVHRLLKKHWGYSQFRGKQESIIQNIPDGRDVAVGAGWGVGGWKWEVVGGVGVFGDGVGEGGERSMQSSRRISK
jgi:hypothetical protein